MKTTKGVGRVRLETIDYLVGSNPALMESCRREGRVLVYVELLWSVNEPTGLYDQAMEVVRLDHHPTVLSVIKKAREPGP